MTAVTPAIAIGFDFDHTLGVDNALEREALFAYAAELGRAVDPSDAAWRERFEALLRAFRAGETTMDAMIAALARTLDVAPARAEAERWRQICYGLVPSHVQAIDGARAALAALRERGVPAAILTNGWTPLQQKKIAAALGDDGLALTVLVSDAIGAIKPSRAAFDALVDALAMPRDRIWYVGDNVHADVAGALAAGLRAVWFDWEGQSYPHNTQPPTLRIASLRELDALAENAIAP